MSFLLLCLWLHEDNNIVLFPCVIPGKEVNLLVIHWHKRKVRYFVTLPSFFYKWNGFGTYNYVIAWTTFQCCTKTLGVHVDEHLTWNTHISHISKKIASGIGAIKRCRPFAPTEALVCAYNAIVQPHFDYCDIVWGNCGETNATKLQKLQIRAARVLTHSSFDAEAGPLFEQLKWCPLARRPGIIRLLWYTNLWIALCPNIFNWSLCTVIANIL